jgi:hypothetical protein
MMNHYYTVLTKGGKRLRYYDAACFKPYYNQVEVVQCFRTYVPLRRDVTVEGVKQYVAALCAAGLKIRTGCTQSVPRFDCYRVQRGDGLENALSVSIDARDMSQIGTLIALNAVRYYWETDPTHRDIADAFLKLAAMEGDVPMLDRLLMAHHFGECRGSGHCMTRSKLFKLYGTEEACRNVVLENEDSVYTTHDFLRVTARYRSPDVLSGLRNMLKTGTLKDIHAFYTGGT